jgi:4-amino-4-deoxy-L-arabinose transferase-like glycosyltransferase
MVPRLAIVGLVAILLLGGLTAGELYRNEGLRARLAWEAFAGGGWLVPTLYGEPHLTKPPGMSLLIALCSLPAGQVTPLTARLPSVLAGAAAVALVGWAVGRAFARAGWLAAAILPCAPAWLDRVPSAEIDMVQLAWVTASLVFLSRAVEDGRFRWWLAALLCVAGGFFTKWTAPAFFYLTAFPLLWWRGELRLLTRRPHLLAAGVAAGLGLGWLFLVACAAGWSAVLDTVSREALTRLSPGHHPRPYPWGELATFPLGFLAVCLPWSLVALPALRPSFGDRLDDRQRLLWQLSLAWLLSTLVFWTLAPGHKPRHVLPAQPAVAVLAALVCVTLPRLRLVPRVALAGWLGVKLVWLGAVVPARGAGRDLAGSAAALARLVPEGDILHLHRLKDEGLLFYYGRPARRVSGAALEPGAWMLLTEEEWRAFRAAVELRAELLDGQGAPLRLTRVAPRGSYPTSTSEEEPRTQKEKPAHVVK